MDKVVMIVINNYTNDARVDRAASTLAQEGYSVTVLALKDENTPTVENLNGYRVERIEVKLKKLRKNPAFQLIKYMEFILKAYKRTVNLKPDIIHAHDLNAMPPAYMATKKTRAKLIYDTHELALGRNVMQTRPKPEKLTWKLMEQFIIKRSDEVITVSPGIARELKKLYKIQEPRVIMNCPEYKQISSSNIIRKKLYLGTEDIIILYQGIIAPNRGLKQLIDACRHLPPKYKLVILGSDSGLRRFLENKIKNAGLKSRVFFLEPVPVWEVLEHVTSADLGTCLVNPDILSHKLTLPNKLFECMNAGIPVITSEAYKEIVEETGCGYWCNSNDPKAIAKTIEDLMEHRNAYHDISSKALAAAKNNYNWQIESQKLLELYENLK